MANIVLVALASTAVVGGIYWGRRTDSHGPKSSLNRVLALWSVALVLGSISLLFTGEAIAGFTQGQVIFVIAGVILGYGIDYMLGTRNRWIVVGSIAGVVVAMVTVFRIALRPQTPRRQAPGQKPTPPSRSNGEPS
jgi:MFS-type transporter involved in bile tolerance (Atg22 family)